MLNSNRKPATAPQGRGLVFGLLVLMFFSSITHAGSVLDFRPSADQVIKDRASITKFKPSMIPKAGGSVVPLHRINKTSPWAAAASLAAIGASIYWEDELNASLNELFLGDQVPVIEGVISGNDGTFVAGSGYVLNARAEKFSTKKAMLAKLESTYAYEFWGGAQSSVYSCSLTGSYITCLRDGQSVGATWGYSQVACPACSLPPDVWPSDGVSMLRVANDTLKFWDSETNTFSLSDPLFYATPEGVGSVEIHAGNVAKIHEWLEINDAAGNTQTVHEYVTIDGNTGAVIGTAQETIDKPIDEAITSGSSQPVTVTFPSIMNVKVDEAGMPAESAAGADNYSGTGFDLLGTAMNSVVDPPSLNPLPDLPNYTTSCQTINVTWMGHGVDFPSSSQCSKLNTMKGMLAWLLSLFTFWLCANLLLNRVGQGN